ncbi:hypothetical protein [Streptomyces subrutilus]|uniref:Tail assembly chaperone n=1 Tax=Streptomyces subrutilus TaxID=36818 RepID=A0A1E5NYB2_9ACTN|nr:hypothetical protein [Streptomyces subrutilus]OEJ21117.1 hypothetical protein BGK67_35080 [Streptomyces subrutilus]
MSSFVIDLDAERREVRYPNGIPVKIGGEQFIFPAEVPAEALDPLLSDDLDLVGFFGDLVTSTGGGTVSEITVMLFRRPKLPRQFYAAVKDVYRVLLGEEQYKDFLAQRPSIPDYVRLTTALAKVYGVELGKLFASDSSSETDSETSSPTSPASTTASTPEESGAVPESPASSAFDA